MSWVNLATRSDKVRFNPVSVRTQVCAISDIPQIVALVSLAQFQAQGGHISQVELRPYYRDLIVLHIM